MAVQEHVVGISEFQNFPVQGFIVEMGVLVAMFIAMTADGSLNAEVPELTRSVLEEIIVQSPTELVIWFLDGTEKTVII